MGHLGPTTTGLSEPGSSLCPNQTLPQTKPCNRTVSQHWTTGPTGSPGITRSCNNPTDHNKDRKAQGVSSRPTSYSGLPETTCFWSSPNLFSDKPTSTEAARKRNWNLLDFNTKSKTWGRKLQLPWRDLILVLSFLFHFSCHSGFFFKKCASRSKNLIINV